MVERHIDEQLLKPHEGNKGSLYQATVCRLRKNSNYKQAHRDLEMSYKFITQLAQGNVKFPDATRVQRLYEYLTGDTL